MVSLAIDQRRRGGHNAVCGNGNNAVILRASGRRRHSQSTTRSIAYLCRVVLTFKRFDASGKGRKNHFSCAGMSSRARGLLRRGRNAPADSGYKRQQPHH